MPQNPASAYTNVVHSWQECTTWEDVMSALVKERAGDGDNRTLSVQTKDEINPVTGRQTSSTQDLQCWQATFESAMS